MEQASQSEEKIWSPRICESKIRKVGCEPFHVGDKNVEFTIRDYWRWAHSDLLDNTARGVLAEFLVAYALRQTNKLRREWGAFDLRTKSGHRVEIKSAAYAQSWPQRKPSKINFDIAPRSEMWDPETNTYCQFCTPKRVADVYVFCLLGQCDGPYPDPMDIRQWKFYVLAKEALDKKSMSQKKIALNPLKALVRRPTKGGATTFDELACVIEDVSNEISPTKP